MTHRTSGLNALLALRAHNPARELAVRRQRLAEVQRRLGECSRQRLTDARKRWERAAGLLRVLGPEGTLQRGYSITLNESGDLVRSTSTVRPKMKIRTRVSDGEFESTVSAS